MSGAVDDVLVVGGGPAGRAVAAACGGLGLRTTLLDPAPDRPWRSTYAAWSAELPAALPPEAVAARARGRAVAHRDRALGWEYAVLDTAALRAHLDAALHRGGVEVRAGRAVGSPTAHGVGLADGGTARAHHVIDAGGHRRPLDPRAGRADAPAAEQTAYGLVVDAALTAPLVAPGEALFMDWRGDHGEAGHPSFLYAVPLGGGAVLLEETSLAARPGLGLDVLQRRLLARLAHHGIAPPADARVERVRFPLDTPRHRGRGVIGFGAAAPLVHPATGFSVATALGLAPRIATALAGAPPGHGTDAVHAVLWPRSARVVHVLRRRGLEALLRMPPADVPAFFDVFFDLPAHHRWAYLTGRDDLRGTLAAMTALFGGAGWELRGRLVAPGLLGTGPHPTPRAG